MAVYTYSLAASDVSAELPIDAGTVGASTEPLSTTDISQYIEDGAGKLNAALEKAGVSVSASMDEEAHAACTEAVKSYAVAKSLLVLGVTGALYDQAWSRWQYVYSEYSSRPQQLGDAYSGSSVSTNIDDIEVDGNVAGAKSSTSGLGSESWSFIGFGEKW